MSAWLNTWTRPRAIDAARLDEHVRRLAAMGAGIHAQSPADRAGDAAVEGEPGEAGIGRRPRHLDVGHGGAGAHALPLDRDGAEAFAAEPDDDAGHAAVAHDQVRAEPDGRHRDTSIGDGRGNRRDRASSAGENSDLRRAADAEPGHVGERGIGLQAAAQFRHQRSSGPGMMSGNAITPPFRRGPAARSAARRPIA